MFQTAKAAPCPPWAGDEGCGIVPELDDLGLNAETLFYRYEPPLAIIEAEYANGSCLTVYLGPSGVAYAEAQNTKGALVTSRAAV